MKDHPYWNIIVIIIDINSNNSIVTGKTASFELCIAQEDSARFALN
jgi:hypothetical protein